MIPTLRKTTLGLFSILGLALLTTGCSKNLPDPLNKESVEAKL